MKNNIYLTIYFLLLFSLFSSCKEEKSNDNFNDYISIYSLVIDSLNIYDIQSHLYLYSDINERGVKEDSIKIFKRNLVINPDLLDTTDYYIKNALIYLGNNDNLKITDVNIIVEQLQNVSHINFQRIIDTLKEEKCIRVLSKEKFNINKIDWNIFYNYYNDFWGIIGLSNIVFNDTKDKSICYIEYRAHYLVGYGIFFICEKINGKWLIIDKLLLWVS